MRRMDSNHRSSDYEPDELTGLLYRAKTSSYFYLRATKTSPSNINTLSIVTMLK